MSKSETCLIVTERQAREIETFCCIARENGALISLGELIWLASIEASEEELETAILSDPKLSSRFVVDSGYGLERTPGLEEAAHRVVAGEEQRKARARANLKTADMFGRFLVKGTPLVSVSGANSYLSAREMEDIDLFCVTKTDGMWLFMLKGLLLARIYRLANKGVPDLCFSCEMDERWATEAFRAKQQPIFARDALTIKVINGTAAYHALLEEAQWMRAYFPAFYNLRMRETDPEGRSPSRDETKAGSSILNSFLYCTMGSFLRMKSWALNRRLAKSGRRSLIFAVRVGKGYYIYESNRYRQLRKMYGELEEDAER